ncbi:glycosyltransferase [Bacteroides sp.]|uniref:glycosyltransferase family 2 protein n=1 Tax=Bacteroides sp. TaxID=29523 RepID=UPI001B7A591B|nr:glycosyltransferase [Bacteroides sp.]MBP6064542.1 glycosyltransferase [Bacteroides sp.]MBP6066703.1 glycosyltransferase [Bacteroides sp.]MBP6935461.1 glycosyltransferase [Bacteroides sp.]MBP9585345.1 glycosyltransferase [Bacteroides sp.]
MQLSIIIPAYNAANYLYRCVESIFNQNLPFECYEAIVINDGSTDNTVDILDTLCSKYSFLRYITTDNRGLSLARNRGVAEASGEFVLFLDSDDSLSSNVLGSIYHEMGSNKLDMMLMNYLFLSTEDISLDIPFWMDCNSRTVTTGKNFLMSDYYPPMVWAYAYRRSFLVENSLEMIPIWHEDEEFTPRAIYLAKRIKYHPLLFYRYYQNSGSYMVDYQESNVLYLIAAMSSLSLFKRTHVFDSDVRKYFDNRIAVTLMQLFKNSIRQGYQNQIQMIEQMKKADLLPLHPKRTHFYFWLFNISPPLFELYYRAIKRKPKRK